MKKQLTSSNPRTSSVCLKELDLAKIRIAATVYIAAVILEQVKIPDKVFSTQGNFHSSYIYRCRYSSALV